MVEINLAPAPRCKFEKCNEIAEFEFTDVVLADKDKKMKNRVLKKVTLAHSCENHVEEVKAKYAE